MRPQDVQLCSEVARPAGWTGRGVTGRNR